MLIRSSFRKLYIALLIFYLHNNIFYHYIYCNNEYYFDFFLAPVGFTAVTTQSKPLGAWQVVPFDKILYSTGDIFNLATNTFTCPVKGTYVVVIDFFTYAEQFFDCYIKKDDAVLIRSYTSAKGMYDHNGGSATIVTECNKGSTIWLIAGGHTGNYIYENTATTHYNRFSVFRI